MASKDRCTLTSLPTALGKFANPPGSVQGQQHIMPLHWYVACRLVLEGGFDPDWITPRPPFYVEQRSGKAPVLHHEPLVGGSGEQTVLGGLKTKRVDVVVAAPKIGPVLAVSLKGTHNAYRNLTNRMEEAAGDCTNLHMSYPALVYGFWHVIRCNDARESPIPPAPFSLDEDGKYKTNDVALNEDGELNEGITRYARALSRLSGRGDLRQGPSKYEACALTMVSVRNDRLGWPLEGPSDLLKTLDYTPFFQRLYELYDERFLYQAPALKATTTRSIWSSESPILHGTVAQSSRFSELQLRMQ